MLIKITHILWKNQLCFPKQQQQNLVGRVALFLFFMYLLFFKKTNLCNVFCIREQVGSHVCFGTQSVVESTFPGTSREDQCTFMRE